MKQRLKEHKVMSLMPRNQRTVNLTAMLMLLTAAIQAGKELKLKWSWGNRC